MSSHRLSRRSLALSIVATPLWAGMARAAVSAVAAQARITDFGAVADDKTINTKAIQAAIDSLAAKAGGTVIVPQGVFVSGALFLKPKVNLHLDAGAVLKCSNDLSNFPVQRTRIEGHFEPAFNPALINASSCDGFQLTGQGTLDGNGSDVWALFYKMRAAAADPKNFPNVGVPRARMAIIENSKNVLVEGVTFKDSQFWNLHLYKCQDVMVRNARFQVPDDVAQAPSTDGIDIDSSQRITVDGCYFTVTDDCIAAKGSKGPHATEDKDSPPVETIRIRNCTFKRGNGILTLGSEATLVRDVIVEDCKVIGNVTIAQLKLRTDTPQHYEDIHYRNITLDSPTGTILRMAPWTQFADLKGEAPPQSVVTNISITGVKGRFGTLGSISPNPGQTTISGILMKDFDVQLTSNKLTGTAANLVTFDNVVVNGAPVTA